MIDIQQLLRTAVAPETPPVLHHLGRKIPPDAGKFVESRRIRRIQIQKGYVNVFFQSPVDGIGHDEGFRKVLFPLETASLFTVIVYGIGLLQRKAESAQVTNRHCIRVKSKGLVSAWSISGSQLLCSFRMFPLALFIAVVLRDI